MEANNPLSGSVSNDGVELLPDLCVYFPLLTTEPSSTLALIYIFC